MSTSRLGRSRMVRPAAALAALAVLGTAACSGNGGEEPTAANTTASASSSTESGEAKPEAKPTPMTGPTKAPTTYEPLPERTLPTTPQGAPKSKAEPKVERQRVQGYDFKSKLDDDVTEEELQELTDQGLLPVAPGHSANFGAMLSALAQGPTPDIMLLGDSMTQQGVDPKVLGEELSQHAGRDVYVFNGASSQARAGINNVVVHYAGHVGRLPKVVLAMTSTRAAESDQRYNGAISRSPMASVVMGCDRPKYAKWNDEDVENCEQDRSSLTHRFREGQWYVDWAREGKRPAIRTASPETATLREDGFLGYPGITVAESDEGARERTTGTNPGFPRNDDPGTDRFNEMVDYLHEQGVTVITAEIPYPVPYQQRLEKAWPGYDEHRREAAANLAASAGVPHFPVLEFGDWFRDYSVRDVIHLSAWGARDFAKQLSDDKGLRDALIEGIGED